MNNTIFGETRPAGLIVIEKALGSGYKVTPFASIPSFTVTDNFPPFGYNEAPFG